LNRHLDALLALIRLQADWLANGSKGGPLAATNAGQRAELYLGSLFSYLLDATNRPDPSLVDVFTWTYSKPGSGAGKAWPPEPLLKGNHLSDNVAIQKGLDSFRKANQVTQVSISNEVQSLN